MTASISILDAVADANLFAPSFGGESWARWRAFLAALFGLPLTEPDLAIYRHHTGRTAPPLDGAFREAALVCGRRAGKSAVLALIAVYLATFRNYEPYLSLGEQAVIAVIAADRKQARVILRYCVGLLRGTRLLAPFVVRDDAESVELTNHVVIEIHTGRVASPRGRTFAAVLCDECSHWRTDDASQNPDIEVLNAVRPGLATIPGSMLLLASSPYARRGALWNAFKRHFGKDDARVLVWQGTSLEMNPTLDPAIVEAALEDDPESAKAEFLAEFRSDIDAFVSRDVVDAVTVFGRHELPPLSAINYNAFFDAAGGSGTDSITIAVSHLDGEIAVLDAVREVKPPFSPESVVTDFAALLKQYDVSTVTADKYAGDWPKERFSVHGISLTASDKSKSDIYREVLPKLNSKKVELLDLPRLASQLVGLERRTGRGGGKDSIDHAPGGHDDVANAACGALLLAETGFNPWERWADKL